MPPACAIPTAWRSSRIRRPAVDRGQRARHDRIGRAARLSDRGRVRRPFRLAVVLLGGLCRRARRPAQPAAPAIFEAAGLCARAPRCRARPRPSPAMPGSGRSSPDGAFVGEHGSWNREPLSGYKVVFVPFGDNGFPVKGARPVDVLSGFLSAKGEAQGRPVGVVTDRTGALLVADDVGDAVWRVSAAAQRGERAERRPSAGRPPPTPPRCPRVERSAGRAFLALADLAWIANDDGRATRGPMRGRSAPAPRGSRTARRTPDRLPRRAWRATDALHVAELAVCRDHQRQGVGSALIAAAVAGGADQARARRSRSPPSTTCRGTRPITRGWGLQGADARAGSTLRLYDDPRTARATPACRVAGAVRWRWRSPR